MISTKMTTTISLPYGSGALTATIPPRIPVYTALRKPALAQNNFSLEEQKGCIAAALDHPIGSPALPELSKGISSLVIVTNDSTRYTPSNISIPLILERLYDPSSVEITLLISTGLHRPMTQAEMDARFGKEIQSRCKILNHDACNPDGLYDLGVLTTGNHLFINKVAMACDLLIAEGSIEPHFFAGYTGGRKSILPGIAGKASILYNHRPENIGDVHARMGILANNPIHIECTEAAVRAKLRFISNYVLDDANQVARAFSGDPIAAYQAGCAYVEKNVFVPVEPSDIVVTSNGGQPLDINLYQTVKGIETAARAAKPNGIIIVVSKCSEGIGSKAFEELITSHTTFESFYANMHTPVSSHDKWQAQILARVLAKHKVILVSNLAPAQAQAFFLTPAATLQEALEIAFAQKKREATLNVLPRGPFLIPSPVRPAQYNQTCGRKKC